MGGEGWKEGARMGAGEGEGRVMVKEEEGRRGQIREEGVTAGGVESGGALMVG